MLVICMFLDKPEKSLVNREDYLRSVSCRDLPWKVPASKADFRQFTIAAMLALVTLHDVVILDLGE